MSYALWLFACFDTNSDVTINKGRSGSAIDGDPSYVLKGLNVESCHDLSNQDVFVRMEGVCWRLTSAGCGMSPRADGALQCECAGTPVQMLEARCTDQAVEATRQ